ncbi:MAG: hypothetical protein ACE5MI_12370 [Acidimicrobiia bacterium]
MNRIRGLALSVGLATLIVVGLACGSATDEAPAANPSAPIGNEPSSRSLTDQDRTELIRQTLERALIDGEMAMAGVSASDGESFVLSTENISASLVPDVPKRHLILLGPEEIRRQADDQGDFMFLSFDRIGPRQVWVGTGWGVDESVIEVVLANTLATGKDSQIAEGYMSGGYFTVEYQQISGEWVGTDQRLAVP